MGSQLFQLFPILQSASASLQIWYLLVAAYRSAIWCLGAVCWIRGRSKLPSRGVSPETRYPQGIFKNHKNFKACLQDPHKSEKVDPGSPEDTNKLQQTLPQDTNSMNKWKMRNHSKNKFFEIGAAHDAATAFRQHFQPRIIKNIDLGTVCRLVTASPKQIKNRLQSGSREPPQMDPEIYRMDTWTSRCPSGVYVDPCVTKVVSQGTQDLLLNTHTMSRRLHMP